MTSQWKEQELNEAEAVEALDEDDAVTGQKKKRIWPSLLLILIVAGAAFVVFAPQETREKYLAPITKWLPDLPDGQREIAKPVPAPKPAPAPAPFPRSKPAAPAVQEKTVVVEKIVPASSDEINRVLNAMQSLQNELSTLRQQQQEMEKQQREVQVMQLRTRLNWITNPANHLPQLQLAWEEISLMPILTDDERQQAKSMLELAQKDLQQVIGWQLVLNRFAESLQQQKHDNIIPAFDSDWLNWIAAQFTVRESLSREEADDQSLRQMLQESSRNIGMEIWPQQRTWLELRARLQLRMLSSAAEADGNSESRAVELPESFDAIRADIETLRSSAVAWQERL